MNMAEDKGQILLYQTPDGESRVEVRLHDETVWLSLDQMAELFQRNKSTISRHIKNVFEEGELNKEVVVAKYATTTQHGAIEGKTQTHEVDYYNLDMIISVGYRSSGGQCPCALSISLIFRLLPSGRTAKCSQ